MLQPPRQTARIDQQVEFNCSVNKPFWFLKNEPLPEDISIIDKKIIIPKVTMNHEGWYICFGNDKQGEEVWGRGVLQIDCKCSINEL